MYNFTFKMTEADYLEFNRHHILSDKSAQKITRITRVVLLICIGFFLVNYIFLQGDIPTTSVFFFIILGVVISFGYKPLMLLLVRLQIKSLKKQGKLPYNKNVQLQFDEENYTEIGDISETKIKYTTIEKVVEGRIAIYLYIGAIQATIVPYSVFETVEQKHNFLAFINSKRP